MFTSGYAHSDTARRVRTLTPKGQETYEKRLADFNRNLVSISREITDIVDDPQYTADKLINLPEADLVDLRQSIMLKYERYLNVYSDVVTFLTSTNTEDSQKEMTVMSLKDRNLRDRVFKFLKDIKPSPEKPVSVKSEPKDNASQKSRSVASSNRTKLSSVMLKQAKVQAARVKVEFAEREAELQRLKAKITEEEMIAAAARQR